MQKPDIHPEMISKYGEALTTEMLNGKSGADVYRVRFAETSLILKRTTRPDEVRFYEQVAPVLRDYAISIPNVEMIYQTEGDHWLALEDIPYALPASRRGGDAEIVAVLARLHTLSADLLPTYQPAYHPAWTDELTEDALANFEADVARQLRPRLSGLQVQAQALFEPLCFVSADPNPGNWGLRDDGTLVLFDWERFTRGAPAIDLAISIGGLPKRAQFEAVAGWYGGPALTQDIALAKAWTVVEYLSLYPRGLLEPDATLDFLHQQFAPWLDSVG